MESCNSWGDQTIPDWAEPRLESLESRYRPTTSRCSRLVCHVAIDSVFYDLQHISTRFVIVQQDCSIRKITLIFVWLISVPRWTPVSGESRLLWPKYLRYITDINIVVILRGKWSLTIFIYNSVNVVHRSLGATSIRTIPARPWRIVACIYRVDIKVICFLEILLSL